MRGSTRELGSTSRIIKKFSVTAGEASYTVGMPIKYLCPEEPLVKDWIMPSWAILGTLCNFLTVISLCLDNEEPCTIQKAWEIAANSLSGALSTVFLTSRDSLKYIGLSNSLGVIPAVFALISLLNFSCCLMDYFCKQPVTQGQPDAGKMSAINPLASGLSFAGTSILAFGILSTGFGWVIIFTGIIASLSKTIADLVPSESIQSNRSPSLRVA